MVSVSLKKLFFIPISIFIFNCHANQIFNLSINEETPINSVVGNIQNFLSNNFYPNVDYSVTYDNKYFSIINNNVVVKEVIDLEKLCDDGLCCGEDLCVIKFEVIILGSYSKNSFIISIEIKDINDNKPYFRTNKQIVSIPENSDLVSIIKIEGAIDKDFSAKNRVKSYKFEDSTKTFTIDNSNLEDLKLFLQKSIDYEKQNLYTGTLQACEDSTGCSTQCQIVIQIDDENDNIPKFSKESYEKTIVESFPVGKEILKVEAIDIDGPKFNKTEYKIVSKGNRNLISRYFKISPDTGSLILKSQLDLSNRISVFKFQISASDKLKSKFTSVEDRTNVIIHVEDINDNKPTIKVLAGNVVERSMFLTIKIKENEPAQKLIGLSVSDRDLKENGRVSCELKEDLQSLELKDVGGGFYDLWSTHPYDYEKEDLIKTLFECQDHGKPSLKEYRTIEIHIEDVNEYPPGFQNNEYLGSLRENTPPGSPVLTVRATDRDKSAELIYSIDRKILKHFSIDNKTGLISTSFVPFDREMTSIKQFEVNVKDDKTNPKTANVLVKIEILDVNDNDPVFLLSSLQFFVQENVKIKTKLEGKLNATDRDCDQMNNFVKYEFMTLYDHKLIRHMKPVFQIRPTTGEIETLVVLDREKYPNWTITVKAYDSGSPTRFAFANATIYVRDLNDNQPEWIYPRPINFQRHISPFIYETPAINISDIAEKHKLILKLKAIDQDENDAGRVCYYLQTNGDNMFGLNETTGELITLVSPLKLGTYVLKFTARDNGVPPLSNDASITVHVQDNGRFANINLTIIIGMIAITVSISVFLIVAIICVRRQPRFQKYIPPSSGVKNDSGNPYCNPKHWNYHTEENPLPPDNESFVFLPPSYCSSPHPDQLTMQVINNSRPASRMDYHLSLPSSNTYNIIESSNGSQTAQNVERLNGTLRSNNGFYGTNIPNSMGIIINGQELDGDSADSGKGASEVDLRLQHQFNLGNRNYPTMPFPHYSTATTSFGHYNNVSPNQYYSINTNPRGLDSRFLTVNPSHLPTGRRVASPSNSNCKCFMLPEDDVIQINQDNGYSMSTFSNRPKAINHDKSCIYNVEELSPTVVGNFYEDYNYCESSAPLKDFSIIDPNETSLENRDIDQSFNDLTENNHNKNLYASLDKNNPEKNYYPIGLEAK